MAENNSKLPLEIFVDHLIEEARIELPADALSIFKKKIKDLLDYRVGLHLLNLLNDDDLAKYVTLINEDPPPERIQAFLEQSVQNFETELQKILEEFKKEFLEHFQNQRITN
ncbi:MAG: hypothetical protein HYW78_00560 [Parcubacteria group bacterium]|nr:hypothetical protein [Parcubacteria group bacterium]